MIRRHFSHHHPLELTKISGGEDEILCYGCQNLISGSAYSCSRGCTYFLHQQCATLDQKINHPLHGEHPLTLLPRPNRESCFCNVCHNGEWKWFTYTCSKCDFNIDVSCALKEQSVIQHDSHTHELTFIQRLSMFYCDACGTEDKDLSYQCGTCSFWIHQSCASSPSKISLGDHDHDLILAYSLPNTRRDCVRSCNICHKTVHPLPWVYYCEACVGYFAHIKCAASKDPLISRGDGSRIKEGEKLIHFPLQDNSVDLISHIVPDFNLQDHGEARELAHFSHDHPLVLFDVQSNKKTEDNNKIICDGCVRPISNAFYSCEQCSFFLHKDCAELPRKLEHPCHPEHPLQLKMSSKFFNSFWCGLCKLLSNGFAFCCESCNFYLDVRCAGTFLPDRIKHEAHQHPLLRFKSKALVPGKHQCIGCGQVMHIYPTFMFGCDRCNNLLDDYCAMLPQKVKHDWDRHPLNLTYSNTNGHPDQFCESCEKDIDPNYWFYHCELCDQYFHTRCVCPFDTYSNIKYGGTFAVGYHSHTLAFVRHSKNKSTSGCSRCRGHVDGIPVLECAPCNFLVCLHCAELKSERVSLVPALEKIRAW